jgi:MerR family transcriptional regulator, light-induced transcriptional regulator
VRMVADFFEMEGWDTYYLGTNISTDVIIDALLIRNANLLTLSITLSNHIPALTETIRAIRADARVQHLPILVGGHPFNLQANLWQEVGADGHGRDAQEALDAANELIYQPL